MNTFITPTWVVKDTAVGFKNHQRLIRNFTKRWDSTWENLPDGAKIGDTTQVRIEQLWEVFEGQALQQQAILNQTVPLTINHQFQIAHGWSSAQKTLEVEEAQRRYTMPAGKRMANEWDKVGGAEVYKFVNHTMGAPGVPITADGTYTDGLAKLRDLGVPDEIVAVITPKAQSNLLKANFTLFNPQGFQSANFKSGQFAGTALGYDEWNWDPNMPMHVTGSFTTSTPLVDGALQTGSTLVTKGWGTYQFRAGDTFTLLGVNELNAISKVDTGNLMEFVIQADLAGSGAATITISPAIITGGPLRNVTASPANNASIAYTGSTGTVAATLTATSSKQSLFFNPEAFAIVMVDLPSPLAGAVSGRMNDKETGIAMRYVDQYNIQTDQLPRRIDTMGGVAAILPAYALRGWN